MLYFPFIIVSIMVTSVMGQCPLQCSCSVEGGANCTRSSLIEIPQSGFNEQLTRLDASFNEITTLSKDSLKSTPQLIHLNLSHNNITNINSQAFITLKFLNSLDLSSNYLNSIDSGIFMYNRELEWLSLADNPTFTLSSTGSFHLPRLWFWNLSYCNIQNIHSVTFKYAYELRELYLHNNKIVSLNSGVFQRLYQLQTLDLGYNALQNADSRVFSQLSNIKSLSLCNNNISTINIALLEQLVRIDEVNLEGNPWICDCNFADVYYHCVDVVQNCRLRITCDFPNNFKHRQWDVIDKLQCTSTTLSTTERWWSEDITGTTTDENTTETIWQTATSEKTVPVEQGGWFWGMIVLGVCCLLLLIIDIALWRNLEKCTRGDQAQNEIEHHELRTRERESS